MGGSLRLTLGLVAFGGEMMGHCARAILARTTKTGRIDRALRRLTNSRTITVSGNGPIDQRIIRLTDESCRAALGGIDPAAAWVRPWDGVWRVVAFYIPETDEARRTRLRRHLHEFRPGWLQNSVWIRPDPLNAFRAGLDESGIVPDSLTYFEARSAGGESPAALVRSAWDFEWLNHAYKDYQRILRLRPSAIAGTQAAWWRWLQNEHRAWRLIARRAPFLPEVLLPADYNGRAAWAARSKAMADFTQVWS